MIENALAGLMVAVCVAMLARMAIGPRRRLALDAALRRAADAVRRAARLVYRWPASRRQAARAADEAIRRARGDADWDGNVARPKSFDKRPRKPH